MERRTPPRSYTYNKISQLSYGMKRVNVIGAVQHFRAPAKTRRSDYSCAIGIADESSNQSMTCVLFNKELQKLPGGCKDGDIICVRRCDFSDGCLTGSSFTSWVLFQDGNSIPVTSSPNCTVSAIERTRVHELRAWRELSNTTSQDSQPLTTNQPPSISHPADNPTTNIVDSSQTFDIDSQQFAATSSNDLRPSSTNRKTVNLPHTNLGSLAVGQGSVAVCGIVQYFKPVTRSRGSDYYITIGLLDETSATNTVSCTLFNPSDQQLISNIPVGQIVLLKGLKTSKYQGRIQATGYNGAIIGVFRNRHNEPVPRSIGDWYSLSNQEKDIIARLKTWSHEQGMLLVNTQLCQFSVGHFFNTVCRVVAVHTCMNENRTVLDIFDGTTPKFPCDHLDTTRGRWTSDIDRQLAVKLNSSIICEVQVTDWNRQFSIKPGQYISLRNVHVEPNCQDGTCLGKNDIQAVKLTLSSKQNSGTITVLTGNESELVNKYLSDFPEPCGPFPIFMRPSNTPPDPLFEIIINDRMKQTATVQEVLKSRSGKLFVVEGQIMSFSNGPIEELCQLRCSMCKTRYVSPRSSDPPLPAEMVCVFCSDSKNDGPRLVYMYVFVMRLKDRTGILDICVTAEDGEIFLHHVRPTNLYARQSSREELTRLLYVLTGGNDPFYPVPTEVDLKRPRVRCCVRTFTSIDGKTRFTLNDTVCKVSV